MKSRQSVETVEGAAVPWKWEWRQRALLRPRESLRQECDERRAVLRAEREVDHRELLAELAAEENEQGEVDATLGRLAAGTYGRCEVTGKWTPAARLQVAPWARYAAPIPGKRASAHTAKP